MLFSLAFLRLMYLIWEGDFFFLPMRFALALKIDIELVAEIKRNPKIATTAQATARIAHAQSPPINGKSTFIPKKPVMNVGNIRQRETIVSLFIITFILLLITEAYASIVPVRISV